jgi:hypothetical protein
MHVSKRESAARTLTTCDVILCLVPIGLFVSIISLV